MTLVFKAKQTIEFIGDSVTDSGRRELPTAPLGTGYVSKVQQLLQAGYPELGLKVLNKGVNGDRVPNLKARWSEDVIEVDPDWLFIYIGINDVWRYFEFDPAEAVPLAEFEKTYREIVTQAQAKTHVQIRLICPFLAEADQDDPFRAKLGDYQMAVDRIGEEFALPVIHLQPAFDWAMLSKPSSTWTADRVHPTDVGHMLIALTILRTCGYRL